MLMLRRLLAVGNGTICDMVENLNINVETCDRSPLQKLSLGSTHDHCKQSGLNVDDDDD